MVGLALRIRYQVAAVWMWGATIGLAAALWGALAAAQRWLAPGAPPPDYLDWHWMWLVPLAFALHEAVHGATLYLAGGRPYFGAKFLGCLPVLYTGYRHPVSRRALILSAAAPAALLVAAALALMPTAAGPYAFALAFAGGAGAAGDAWLIIRLLGAPAGATVRCEPDGCTVLWQPGAGLPGPWTRRLARAAEQLLFAAGFAVTLLAAVRFGTLLLAVI